MHALSCESPGVLAANQVSLGYRADARFQSKSVGRRVLVVPGRVPDFRGLVCNSLPCNHLGHGGGGNRTPVQVAKARQNRMFPRDAAQNPAH